MGLFGRTKKKCDVEETRQIDNFNSELNKLSNDDKYVARSDYKYLKEDYKKTYDHYVVLSDTGMIKQYCKKNKIDATKIKDFMKSYTEIQNIFKSHNAEFVNKYKVDNKQYLDDILKEVDPNIILDANQRDAVVCDEDYCLIIAGAGAGKTTTIAAKVKYLVEKKNVNPSNILIVSFTNKAVDELKERINDKLKIDCPITTFHSTGNAILRKNTDEKLKIAAEGFLYKTVNEYLSSKTKDKKFYDNLLLFFGSYFEGEFDAQDKEAYFNYLFQTDFTTLKSNLNEYKQSYIHRQTKKSVTLNNEFVNSAQEVQIANFLYLNGIEYEYEPVYPYHIYKAKKKYTPDFLITQGGKKVYLEHFGISEDGKNNLYTPEELERYKKAVNDKIKIHREHNTKLIYTFSKYNDNKELLVHLKELLEKEGFELKPKNSKDIIDKLVSIEENKYISKFIKLICKFIGNFKVNGYGEEDFYRFIRTTKSVRTKLFLEICKECYLEYQKALSINGAVDFQDMINDAAKLLREVQEMKQKLPFKYIIVDEYQDISNQRFDLVKELSKVCDAKIVVVGDDWQSIYAFSGSNVSLFTKFEEKMGYCEELKIVNTYRNAQEVIDIAGNFIQKNELQKKKALKSPKHIDNPVYVMAYDDTRKKYNESGKKTGPQFKMAEAIEKSIEHILSNSDNKKKMNILLIGRYNFDGQKLSTTGLFEYNDKTGNVKSVKYPNVELTFLTAHSSKGLGYDNVIIINAKDAVFGFPSKIENDPVMNLVINLTDEMDYAEERRLFYVALTRTKNRIYIVTPDKHPSAFVLELIKDYPTIKLSGELDPQPMLITNKVCPVCGYPLQRRHKKDVGMDLWVCTNESEICGFLSNNLSGGKMGIQKCDCCDDGYLIVKTKDGYPLLGCTNYKTNGTGCNRTISLKESENVKYSDEFDEINKEPINFIAENTEKPVMKTIQNEEKEIKYFSDQKLNSMALELREYAIEESKKLNIDFWNIFERKTIISICKVMPTTIEKLKEEVYGIGEVKAEKYGEKILAIVSKYQNSTPIEEPPIDEKLLKILKKKRLELSESLFVPLYVISSNRELEDIARYKPLSKEEYVKIKGCRDRKYESYGKYLVEMVVKYALNEM